MQTVYYTTSNFIRPADNVVDLEQYRRRMARSEGSLAPVPQPEPLDNVCAFPGCGQPVTPAAPVRPPRRRLSLDSWASIGILVMTISFTLRVLVF